MNEESSGNNWSSVVSSAENEKPSFWNSNGNVGEKPENVTGLFRQAYLTSLFCKQIWVCVAVTHRIVMSSNVAQKNPLCRSASRILKDHKNEWEKHVIKEVISARYPSHLLKMQVSVIFLGKGTRLCVHRRNVKKDMFFMHTLWLLNADLCAVTVNWWEVSRRT